MPGVYVFRSFFQNRNLTAETPLPAGRQGARREVIFLKICQNTPQLCWGDEWLPSPLGGCVVIASGGERRSGSKALECGSFRLWEIGDCIKMNVFMLLARLNPNG
jgi:hypothetical protein